MATTASVQRVTTPKGDDAWRVTDYELMKRMLSDPRLGRWHPEPERAARFSDSAFGGPQAMQLLEGEGHIKMRRLLSPAFSPKRMNGLRAQVQALVDHLLGEMAKKTPPVDLHEALAFPLPALVICQLLGVPFEDAAQFRSWSDDASNTTDRAVALAGRESLERYMRGLVERKRREPGEDVISDLIAAQPGDPTLTDEFVIALSAGLLWAGHETTVSAVDRGVLLLLTNQEQREALERDPSLVTSAVEEIIRYHDPLPGPTASPTGGLSRYANADIEVDGITIRAGDLVLFALQSANMDERHFANPDAFDVTRDNKSHLGFGYGPHLCLGAPLARLELQTVFGTLFKRFPTLRLAVPVEQLRGRSTHLTGGLEELPVTW